MRGRDVEPRARRSRCICEFLPCDGGGVVRCRGCSASGARCVCVCGGSLPCGGCVECEPDVTAVA